nr:ABC transporter substrate-binding protein [Clostridium senegalense]
MKKIILLTLTILILLFSFSIEGNDENSKSNQKNKYVIYNMEQRPKNLIMTDNKNVREKDLIVSLFEGLVSLNDKGEIVPALCKEYNVSEDGIQYTFNLRENIRYSNGEKITANDFVQFFEEFLCDEKNIYREDLNCIFGVKQFINDTEDFSNVAIKAIDEKTLAIRLNNPCENFIYMLSKPVMSLRKYTALKNENTITKDTLFTGPFIIQDITHDNEIVISKNKNYYKNNLVTNEKLLFLLLMIKKKH